MQANGTAVTSSGHLAIKPQLLQFLQVKEHLSTGQPLVLNSEGIAAMYLGSLLLNKQALRDDQRHHIPADYTAKLHYKAPNDRDARLHVFLTPTRVIRFNSFLHHWMMQTLYERVDLLLPMKLQEKRIIEGFVEEFELHEVVNVESLKRACTRRRDRLMISPLKNRKDGRLNRENGGAIVQPRKSPYLVAMNA